MIDLSSRWAIEKYTCGVSRLFNILWREGFFFFFFLSQNQNYNHIMDKRCSRAESNGVQMCLWGKSFFSPSWRQMKQELRGTQRETHPAEIVHRARWHHQMQILPFSRVEAFLLSSETSKQAGTEKCDFFFFFWIEALSSVQVFKKTCCL